MNVREETIIPRFARIGYAAKGTTYLLMGCLALRAAFGNGTPQNTRGALALINGPLLGKVVVAVIAAGLAAYGIWRGYVAVTNSEDDGLLQRLGIGLVGIFNLGVAAQAAWIARGSSAQREDQTVLWTDRIMDHEYGAYVVAAAGAWLAGYGVWQLIRAIVARLDSALRLGAMQRDYRKVAVAAARFGIAARGVVFVLIGLFVIDAARDADPADARDFGRTLRTVHEQPSGDVLLAIVAGGLLAYAFYEFIRARYRIIRTT